MSTSTNIVNTDSLAKFRRIEKHKKQLKKTKLTKNGFLKDQIVNHDRIDLLMTEVLGYTIMDFHFLMWQHRKVCHKKIDKQQWHLALAPRGGGKCCLESTKVQLLDGSCKEIKDIKVGESIPSLNEDWGIEPDRVIAKVKSGKKKVYKITLKSGRTISSSLDHRYRKVDDWVKLSDLTKGDKIAVPRYLPTVVSNSKKQVNENEAKLLAYMIADGSLSSGNCDFTKYDKKISQDFVATSQELGFVVSPKKGCIERKSLTSGARSFFRSYGLYGKKSKEKFIPEEVFCSTPQVKSIFLNRLFDCDGYVDKYHLGLGIMLSSKVLINDIQRLLLHFGIQSRINFKAVWLNGKKFDNWRLTISDKESVLIFDEEIGLFSKQTGLDKIVNKKILITGNPNVDVVPAKWKTFLNNSPHFLRKNFGIRADNQYDTSRDKLCEISKYDKNKELENLSKSDVFWDEVESIEFDGYEETYDIQTLKNKNFVAESIIVHNSTILTVASVVMDILKDPNTTILIASKTDENAVGFLTEIKQHLESKRLIEIFGPQKGDVWNTGEINVAGRTKPGKENTVTTRGKGSALASKHFDKIYGDDLVDEENSKTPTQRKTTWTWFFKIVVPTLRASGQMSIIGTRYHPEDLYGALIDSVFTKKDKKGKIIKKYYIRIPALLKRKNATATTKAIKKYVSFWPCEFSVKFLLASRKNSGTIIFNCLTPNTPVFTKRGFKVARDIKLGDVAWTGKWRKITAIKQGQHNGNTYSIKTFLSFDDIELTGGHRVLANNKFINANEVKPDDVVQFPINQNSDLSQVPAYFRKPEIFRLIGHWLANGCNYGDTGNNRWKIIISLGTHRKKEIDDVCKLVSDNLIRLNRSHKATSGTSKVTKSTKDNNCIDLIFTNKRFHDFLQQFGKYAHGKKLPWWVYDLPHEYLIELFRGYYIGDGFYLRSRGDLGVNSVSKQLLSGFQLVLFKLGIISRTQKVCDAHQKVIDDSGKLRNCKALYGIFLRNSAGIRIDSTIPNFNKRKYAEKGWIENGVFNVKVRSVEVKKFEGTTYDFEVKKDHIFTSGLITLHNSQMQNDVDAMKGKIFKVDWFHWYKIEDINIKELKIFQGVDLAIKQKEDADKFAHVTIGIHPKSLNIYVLDYYNRVTHYTEQKKVIKNKFDKYDPIKVAIEANGYQRALIQDMQADSKLSSIRAVPVFTETDKTIRAWKLSAYFERGQILLLEGMHEMQQHLLKMPDGRYKDLFDALDIAVTSAFGGKKKTRKIEPRLM